MRGRAIDVASGLGYAAAVLARLGAEVVALQPTEPSAQAARERLAAVGMENVTIVYLRTSIPPILPLPVSAYPRQAFGKNPTLHANLHRARASALCFASAIPLS